MLRISEATALALHTMTYLARNVEEPVSTREIAAALHASEAHLAKVLQRLAKAGLVTSQRGPGGGFLLACPGTEITLLKVYETVEGPLRESHCLFQTPVCDGTGCIMGDLLARTQQQVRSYLSKTRLADLVDNVDNNEREDVYAQEDHQD